MENNDPTIWSDDKSGSHRTELLLHDQILLEYYQPFSDFWLHYFIVWNLPFRSLGFAKFLPCRHSDSMILSRDRLPKFLQYSQNYLRELTMQMN